MCAAGAKLDAQTFGNACQIYDQDGKRLVEWQVELGLDSKDEY